jgi:hypothetical protein
MKVLVLDAMGVAETRNTGNIVDEKYTAPNGEVI